MPPTTRRIHAGPRVVELDDARHLLLCLATFCRLFFTAFPTNTPLESVAAWLSHGFCADELYGSMCDQLTSKRLYAEHLHSFLGCPTEVVDYIYKINSPPHTPPSSRWGEDGCFAMLKEFIYFDVRRGMHIRSKVCVREDIIKDSGLGLLALGEFQKGDMVCVYARCCDILKHRKHVKSDGELTVDDVENTFVDGRHLSVLQPGEL